MKIICYFIVLCAPFAVRSADPAGTNIVTPQLIADLAEEARTNNSALWAARSRLEAAEWSVKSLPLWRDPEVMVGGMAAERMMRAEDGDIVYGVEQQLPIFGKEKAAREQARSVIPVRETELDLQFQNLRKNLAIGLFQAALADEIYLLAQEDLLWLETLLRSLEQQFEAGRATQSQVLRTQNLLSTRREQLATERNNREIAYATLNRLLNRNLHSAWAALDLPEVFPAIPYNEDLLKLATRFEPRLQVLRAQIESAQSSVRLARKERLPDLAVAAEARQYSRTGEGRSAGLLLKMNLPWVNRSKYQAAIEREKSNLQELENMMDDMIYETRMEVHHLIARIDNARRDALLYRDQIIPRSERALASAQAGWAANQDLFNEVLESHRMLLDARVMYHKAVAEQYSAIADLVLCCGLGDLEAIEAFIFKDTTLSNPPAQP